LKTAIKTAVLLIFVCFVLKKTSLLIMSQSLDGTVSVLGVYIPCRTVHKIIVP